MPRIEQYETVLLEEYRLSAEEPGKIYVMVGTAVARECGASVAFHCPCGCGKEIWLPCHTEEDGGDRRGYAHCWELVVNADKSVTLHPSILDRGACKSHYFIEAGKVVWC